MQTRAADPLIGRTLEGRYRILDRIARGGMSTVYSAVDERLDRLVAVKVMSAALSADPSFTDRFAREARAAARLAHTNAVSVYDQGFDSGPSGHHVFLVMELVEGRTLRELLRERGALSPAEALSIMEPVLSALSVAHRAGLVHRDIKPENILLSDDGVVKVADFGLARAVESDAADTRTGLMMGTVAYCAPEQVSRGHADQRSDVYSAGIVLFELVTGTTPYRGDTAMNIAYQHVHSRVPAPSSRVRGIPYEIDELVVTATDSDPAARPADAGALLAEVADAREALRLPVVPVPPRPRPHGRAASVLSRHGATSTAPGPHAPAAGYQTTEVLTAASGRHDTIVAERPNQPQAGNRPPPPIAATSADAADAAEPPPAPRRRRRHRAVIAFLIVLLLGAAAAYGGWWFAAGRYSRIPDLTGAPVASARSDLDHAHYRLGSVSQEFSETVNSGRVIRTEPGVGARVVRGGGVAVVVSKGPERFAVPKVAGDLQSAARTALAAIPVRVAASVTPRSSESIQKGLVIGTQPAAGQKVRRGQAVTLIVSSGPPIVAIPIITPETAFADAQSELTAAGFSVTRTDEYSSDVPAGVVISSEPTGTAVKGTTIALVVSQGPQLVTVPKIGVRSSLGKAEEALTNAGLAYKVRSFGISSRGAPVLAISPSSGSSVSVGSTVTIYVL